MLFDREAAHADEDRNVRVRIARGESEKLAASFGGPPNYEAANSDTNTNLQITNLPGNIIVASGGMAYVTELYTTHSLITPLDRLGVSVPNKLYSVAYF